MYHPDKEINHKFIQLFDALCTWERSTGRSSVLIFREVGNGTLRVMDGKPVPKDRDISDIDLLMEVMD